MINTHRLLIALIFTCLLPFNAFSEALVVDDSENFALLDEQQTAHERPVANERHNAQINNDDYELPLAKDDNESNHNSGNASLLLDKVQGLQQEIQELRGQLEIQAHDLKLLQQQQVTFYKDLDARLRHEPLKASQNDPSTDLSLSAATPPESLTPNMGTAPIKPIAGAGISTPPAVRNNPADEQISYLAAYELVKNKRFDEALVAMQTFVTQYPQGGYTANAEYWLGELYMVKKNYPEAMLHFNTVLKQFPSSSKTAASTLKIGYALAASGKKQEAIQQLQQVIKNYPDTQTAKLAKTKLESLGHS